jgi:hypothetical protein
MISEIESMTSNQRAILVRVLSLAQIPKEAWTKEDVCFFRNLRESLRGIGYGRPEQWERQQIQCSLDQ